MTEKDARTQERQVNPELAAIYAPEALAAAPILLSEVDREPQSASYGIVDREHWSWKFRDYPIGTFQLASYPVSLLWRYPLPGSPYVKNDRVLQWVIAMFENTLTRQHRNGAFSAFVPFEQDPMSTLQLMYGLARTREILGTDLPSALDERYCEAFARAVGFAGDGAEKHAFVSNHSALMAVSFHDAFDAVGDEKYRHRAEAVIDRILEQQSAEGWYNEYGGPDPGYETVGIFYLAQYWQRTRSERVLESLRRSVEFQANAIHPDGSVGGVYGSRHTSLYMPGGFEILASEIPLAGSIARYMRERFRRRNVVTPSAADTENVVPLSYGYLEACLVPPAQPTSLPSLPCEQDGLRRHFQDSRLSTISTRRYYAVVNARKGGVCRVFDRASETLAYEDAGYLVRSGGRGWTSQILGMGDWEGTPGGDQVTCATRLAEVRQELPSPLRIIVLRLLNLTLFRHAGLGNWIRKQISVRLILSKKPGPFRLRRHVTFHEDRIDVADRLERTGTVSVDDVVLPRSFTAIHMGSSKYFHPNELALPPEIPVKGMREHLNQHGSAEFAFSVIFSDDAEARLVAR